MVPNRFLYMGYLDFTKDANFMISMLFSTTPIAACDLSSQEPPHLDNIWGPKSLPVSRFFYFCKLCDFYDIFDTFKTNWRLLLSLAILTQKKTRENPQQSSGNRLLYIGSSVFSQHMTFMRFMLVSKNPITGCDLASPEPPHFGPYMGSQIACCL